MNIGDEPLDSIVEEEEAEEPIALSCETLPVIAANVAAEAGATSASESSKWKRIARRTPTTMLTT